MPEYTPGPWRTDKWGHVIDSKGRKVVSYGMALGHGYGDEEIEANDRLIAAAPDLLEALNLLTDAFENDPVSMHALQCCNTAHAAIAKATGKPPCAE